MPRHCGMYTGVARVQLLALLGGVSLGGLCGSLYLRLVEASHPCFPFALLGQLSAGLGPGLCWPGGLGGNCVPSGAHHVWACGTAHPGRERRCDQHCWPCGPCLLPPPPQPPGETRRGAPDQRTVRESTERSGQVQGARGAVRVSPSLGARATTGRVRKLWHPLRLT